jgi:hypothetical protein
MAKQVFTFAFLIVITVSCAPTDQSEPLRTVTPTVTPPTATSTLTPSPTATAQFTPTLLTLQTPSIPGDEPRLVFFISEQGKFQAWVPVAGDIVEYTITRALFGKAVECSIVGFSLNSASVTVQYCDLASEESSSLSDKAIIEEVRNTMKSEMHLWFDHEEMGLVEGSYPSLTVSGTENMGGNAGTFKARIILAEHRVYFVHMYVYQVDWCYCRHQMDQVVDSFYVDPYMSIPFEPTPTP